MSPTEPVEQIVAPLLKKLSLWHRKLDPLIVAMDGYPGAGKSTLANFLESEGVTVIRQDEYLLPLKQRLKLIGESRNPGHSIMFDFHEDRRLMDDVSQLKSGIVVVEGVFLLEPKRYSGLWDKRVYVAADWGATDARRVRREKERWGAKYMPESHPKSLFAIVVKTYRAWAEATHPEQTADLVIGPIDKQP